MIDNKILSKDEVTTSVVLQCMEAFIFTKSISMSSNKFRITNNSYTTDIRIELVIAVAVLN